MNYPLQEIFSGRERAARHRKRSAVAAGMSSRKFPKYSCTEVLLLVQALAGRLGRKISYWPYASTVREIGWPDCAYSVLSTSIVQQRTAA
jgi:hypothetical protein